MGRNNQQRRAAKARERAKARSTRTRPAADEPQGAAFGWAASAHPPVTPPPPTLRDQVSTWMGRALDALEVANAARVDAACDEIVALAGTPERRRIVTGSLTELLAAAVGDSWRRGWQPIDLHRFVGRELGAEPQPVIADAIAHQLSRHATGTIAPRWPGQLVEMDATLWWAPQTDHVDARASSTPGGLIVVVPQVIRVAHLLAGLPMLERHDPLPGHARPQRARSASAADDRILSRVRALLAKAESTTFEAEAETFTAGAQALMARHSIDAAMLAASMPGAERPSGRRVWVDRPYEPPKVLLLDVVASANRCRSVWSKHLGFVTVIGFDADIDAAETIFTSLLVQANHAMSGQGRRSTRGGHSRTRAFRQSFLMAFAHRIGERLREVTQEETDAAVSRAGGVGGSSGQELVRVLSARAEEVEESVAEMFPDLVTKSVGSSNDAEGWHAGRQAADQANLCGAGRAVAR